MEQRKQELDDFKQMLEKKRDERQQIISRISEELRNLRQCKEDFEKEKLLRIGLEKQVVALKEVSAVSNEMLQLRETQVNIFFIQSTYSKNPSLSRAALKVVYSLISFILIYFIDFSINLFISQSEYYKYNILNMIRYSV